MLMEDSNLVQLLKYKLFLAHNIFYPTPEAYLTRSIQLNKGGLLEYT